MNMVMCHMWADTLDELLAMADKIGVKRKWIQGHPELSFGRHRSASWVHFDVCKAKRAKAIKHGAIQCDRFAALEHCARLDIASGHPALIAAGNRRLEIVQQARERRADANVA